MSSVRDAAINLTKVCIGSGILALPYAVSRGGLLFSPLFLIFLAYLNHSSCEKMIQCKNLTLSSNVPSIISNQYSKIAYLAIGHFGSFLADFSLIVTLGGVCATYIITAVSLFADLIEQYDSSITSLSNESYTIMTLVVGIIIFIPCCSSDVSNLAKISLIALISLLVGIAALFGFGFYEHLSIHLMESENKKIDIKKQSLEDEVTIISHDPDDSISLHLWPEDLSDIFISIGILSFCFGFATHCFPVEESMGEMKSQIMTAVVYCLMFVVVFYIFVGEGLYYFYVTDPDGISSNILGNLPQSSIAADIVRISIGVVCILSIPLTFVPPASMIEKYYSCYIYPNRSDYDFIGTGTQGADKENNKNTEICGGKKNEIVNNNDRSRFTSLSMISGVERYVIRFLFMCSITIFAAVIPCFGSVVSLLGVFGVSILSYILPNIVNFILNDGAKTNLLLRVMEITHVLFGCVICILGTVIAWSEITEKIAAGVC